MAISVIDMFEAVQVEERQPGAAVALLAKRALEVFEDSAAIVGARQRVKNRCKPVGFRQVRGYPNDRTAFGLDEATGVDTRPLSDFDRLVCVCKLSAAEVQC